MPRRSTGENSTPRRQSARIAASVTSKPSTPASTKKSAPKRTSKKVEREEVKAEKKVEVNGTEPTVSEKAENSVEPVTKKAKPDAVETTTEKTNPEQKSMDAESASSQPTEAKPPTVESKEDDKKPLSDGGCANAASEEHKEETKTVPPQETSGGFEVVEKADVPAADSEEVKAVISAQGEDGQLLVNYVQVSKDDVPAATATTNSDQPTNGFANGATTASNGNCLPKGDAEMKECAPVTQKAPETAQPEQQQPVETPVSH